jgi:hypothetical protein
MRRAEEISKCIGEVLSKSEGVKRKLGSWKVRIVGIRELANYLDHTNMK